MKTEVSKGLKITLILSIFVTLLFGVEFAIFPDLYREVVEWPFVDPVFMRFFGVTFFAIAFMLYQVVKIKEWSRIRIFVQFMIVELVLIDVINFWSIMKIPFTQGALPYVILDTLVTTFAVMLFSYFYWVHQKADR